MFNKFKSIVKNVVRCKSCGDVIESTKERYWNQCSCGNVSVDGGLEWLRRVYGASNNSPSDAFEDLSEVIDYEDNLRKISELDEDKK